MKGKILKAITFLTVIGLIFAIVRNSVPVTTSENAGSINGQDPAGMTVIATVSGWRVKTPVSIRYGSPFMIRNMSCIYIC